MKYLLKYSLFESKKLTTEEYITKAKQVHGDKYDYSKVDYKGSTTKIIIICPKHHIEFSQNPYDHLEGKGCPECGKEIKLLKQTKPIDQFIEDAKKVHGDKYDYSQVEYINNHKKVKIICPIHHIEFLQEPAAHLMGEGCPDCGLEKSKTVNIKSTEQFITDAKEKFGDKYDYSLVDYKGSKIPITIICRKPKHGEFSQKPNDHLGGKGCPRCSESKGEIFVALYLKNKNISFTPQYKFDNLKFKLKLPFDFFLQDLNICIECDGLQHYVSYDKFGGENALILQQQKDKLKTDYCKTNNIKLIRIPYWDIKNIPAILDNELK